MKGGELHRHRIRSGSAICQDDLTHSYQLPANPPRFILLARSRSMLSSTKGSGEGEMKPMHILWKRLVQDGETCARCGDTGRELEAAVDKLAVALRPLEIEPVLEARQIDEAEFKTDTSESNRVWIAGKPIEEWLGADVGMSRCCSVCGDSECRTLEVDGRTFETIQENQFIRAGLMAASQMIASASSPEKGATACSCAVEETEPCSPGSERAKGGCCT